MKRQILPLTIMTTGALLNLGDIKYRINEHMPNTNTDLDDILQYVPAAEMYIADIFGTESKSTVWDQTKYLLISQAITNTIVYSIKSSKDIERPNGDGHSFPSGHTARAFVNAAVLFHEFKDTSPLLAWSGYVVATTTAVLRMTNNYHWAPDVVFSAGFAILVTNVVYHWEPLKNWQPFKKNKDIAFTPIIGPSSAGLYVRF